MIDITNSQQSKKKEKKLNLSVSKEQFCNSMIFDSEKEKNECKRYLDLKGISYHARLANYIGFNNEGKVSYKEVAILYRYDKRIRNILYKFLAALEEEIRGYISNHFSGHVNETKWIPEKIKKAIKNSSTLSKELENLLFSELLNLSRKMPKKFINELYKFNNNLKSNLDAVNKLRNAISHHRLLILYDNFETCSVNGQESNTLTHNIENLKSLLNRNYQEPLKMRINECSNDSSFKEILPNKAILNLD